MQLGPKASWDKTPMVVSKPLIDFFLREIATEEEANFPRLSRIPDSRVLATLTHYKSLDDSEREAFRNCAAHVAHRDCGFVIDAPDIDLTQHPYFEKWRHAGIRYVENRHSVPLLRAMVQQYKIDAHRSIPSCISKDDFDFASSVRSVKALELRKRVRAALKPLGYYKLDEFGAYHCRSAGREFLVHVDYGGRSAQLRYSVALPEFARFHPLIQFCFERALGFGLGDWDYIVEDNVDDAMSVLADVVNYCVTLPDRIRAAVT
jgi:hypothetical protein